MDVPNGKLLAVAQGDNSSTTAKRKGERRKKTANFRRVLELCIKLSSSLCLNQAGIAKYDWGTFAEKAQAIF